MLGLKILFVIGSLFASCHAFWWGRESTSQAEQQTASPPVRQFPISYIRAFAYHPVAFPQPLAPITTYQVSRNPPSYNPSRNYPSSGLTNALSQAFQQKFLQSPENPQGYSQQQNSQSDYGTSPTTTTTTSTTTPAPMTTTTQSQSFPGSQPVPQVYTRFADGYQRQLPIQQAYQSGNFGGFPQVYSQPFPNQPFNNPFQFEEPTSNQFSGRLFGGEPNYQQYSTDPLTYQFIPTSVTPMANQNNVKFVPCMCPVSVSISPPLVEKRNDEIPILNPTTEPESKESAQSLSQLDDERK